MRSAQDVLDDILVLSCQRGDVRAFELLARRWHPRLVRHAFCVTRNAEAAADAAQEAWMGIVKGIGGLKDPARFPAWALRIVQNKSRDWIRRETRRREAIDRELREPTSVRPGPETTSPESARLRELFQELKEEQQVMLRLFYVEDRPVGDIAEIVDLPIGTVKSRLFYARRRLRELFEADRSDG